MKRSITDTNNSIFSSDQRCSAFHAYRKVEKRLRPNNRKRVTFSDASKDFGVLCHFPLHEQITEEDRRSLWFQKDELAAAKQHMRYLILHGSEEEHGSYEMSGLRRYSLERSQHKRSAIYYVIAAYRENPKNHDFVREVSKRCTGWARQVAQEEGFATFCQVYGDPVEIDSHDWRDMSLGNLHHNQTAVPTERIASVTPAVSPTFAS